MIVSPDEAAQLGAFLPKLISFVGSIRLLPEPKGPIAAFINAHSVEISIIERISDYFFPGSGGVEKLLLFALQFSHPMDQAEAAEWMRRQDTET